MASRIEQIIEEIEEYIDGCKYQALSSSKIIVNKDELEELLNEEEFDGYLMEYMDYLTVKMADYIRMKIIDKNWRILSGAGGEEDGEDGL